MTRRVTLHVGGPKTGSSAIQSALSINRERLMDAGVQYPSHRMDALSVSLKTSSGNIWANENWITYVQDALRNTVDFPRRLLFSSELLLRRISDHPDDLRRLSEESSVDLILFVRDPIPWAISAYGQALKRGKETRAFESWLPSWPLLERSLTILNLCDELGIKVSARNYSRTGNHLLREFQSTLGLSSNFKFNFPNRRVNRSLNREEAYLVREASRFGHGALPAFIAAAFVEGAPHVKPAEPLVDGAASSDLIERFGETIHKLNLLLPSEERLQVNPHDSRLGQSTSPPQEPDYLILPLESWQSLIELVSLDTKLSRSLVERRLLAVWGEKKASSLHSEGANLRMDYSDVPKILEKLRHLLCG